MNHVRRQPVAALAAVCVLALVLTGCGSRTQTQQWYTPADGVSAEAGDIAVRNVLVVATESGNASTVLATFANRGDEDHLVEVRVGDATATPTGGDLTIPANGFATLGPGETRVDVDGADTVPGTFVEVEFLFESAPRTTVDALVQPADGDYEDALIAPREQRPTP